jgi:hypothetical protein
VTSVAGYTLSRYINGKLRRQIAISGSYDFPVGTTSDYELANLNIASQVGMANIIVDATPHQVSNKVYTFSNLVKIIMKI